MYECQIVAKYLIPRLKSFGTSAIAFVSTLVIALVVWLVLVFLSVQSGIQTQWVEKLVALNAPVQVRPTAAYFDSYYYQIDKYAASSSYSYKTLSEKLSDDSGNPYDPQTDAALPPDFPQPLLGPDGKLLDLVHGLKSCCGQSRLNPFEVGIGNLRLTLLPKNELGKYNLLSQVSYALSLDTQNTKLQELLAALTDSDFNNQLYLLGKQDTSSQDSPANSDASAKELQAGLTAYFASVTFTGVQVGHLPYLLPYTEAEKLFSSPVQTVRTKNRTFVAPEGFAKARKTLLDLGLAQETELVDAELTTMPANTLLYLLPQSTFPATLATTDFNRIQRLTDLRLAAQVGSSELSLPYSNLDLTGCVLKPGESLLFASVVGGALHVPTLRHGAVGVYVADNLKKNEVKVGDRGYMSYYSQQMTGVSEARLSVYVAGFYNPGLMPAGRFVLMDEDSVSQIRASLGPTDSRSTTGFMVWFADVSQADSVKASIQKALTEKGLAPFWTVETYKEYEFSKPFVEQLSSDMTLLTLIALIIILVACSNIVSLIILLVNDKRKEIGILRALGARLPSIALIFGGCGMAIGVIGCALGTVAAMLTLANLDSLIGLLSWIQGHDAFNAAFYGKSLPKELQPQLFWGIGLATCLLALLAGVIPAIKACLIKPSVILKSE